MKRLVADVSDSFFYEVKRYCADHPNTTQRDVVVQGVRAQIGSAMTLEEIMEMPIDSTEEEGDLSC